ncbi:diacylglycerol kinase catalytic domain-containing protein [Saccharicrinis fermentans]|uniref:Putative sugar kinase n=1 Tax=Saccharicrinis fermentans DSM 9555 = JCM 21142 TaxID=869213 RepID=W7YCV5_9BACT|nr:hypothetical protein [Saccharicrinis fermentans]GAF02281.1 putative sugar kinase [Saccharicrinis fermentans DSM 9555 = JCM 21142]
MSIDNVIIVTHKTRLELLIERFNTKAQARFYIEHSGGRFEEYELEHDCIKKSLDEIQKLTNKHLKFKVIDRSFLPNFMFSASDSIVVLGQDGLVANTAKYAKGLPMIPVNPDPVRNDGVLLPFKVSSYEKGLLQLLEGKCGFSKVTMAEAKLNDGQSMLAFNDLFIGPSSHTSARYQLSYKQQSEQQSSSGIIVSTGAGSTGWLSSLLNMANGIYKSFDGKHANLDIKMDWNEKNLIFVVREPFKSQHSDIRICAGIISKSQPLNIESYMPMNGKIFSDGLEDDYLQFNAGSIAEIGIANESANIVLSQNNNS